MHLLEQCEHGTLVRQCRCPSSNKTIVTVPCPPFCPFSADQEVRFHLVVTVVPNHGNTIKTYPEDGEKYVRGTGLDDSTESLHPYNVLDAIRSELGSDDEGSRTHIRHRMWHVKSVKMDKRE